MQPPKKRKEAPKDELYRILEQTKQRIREAQNHGKKSRPSGEERNPKSGKKSLVELDTSCREKARRDKVDNSSLTNNQREARMCMPESPDNSRSFDVSDEVARLKELVKAQEKK